MTCNPETLDSLSGDDRKRAAKPYEERDAVLKSLGFRSYAEYLQSDLWKSIREEVLAVAKGKCRKCGEPATQVHHARYNRTTMTGYHLTYLVPLCAGCHDSAERFGGRKTTPAAANEAVGFDPKELIRCVKCKKLKQRRKMTNSSDKPLCRKCNAGNVRYSRTIKKTPSIPPKKPATATPAKKKKPYRNKRSAPKRQEPVRGKSIHAPQPRQHCLCCGKSKTFKMFPRNSGICKKCIKTGRV